MCDVVCHTTHLDNPKLETRNQVLHIRAEMCFSTSMWPPSLTYFCSMLSHIFAPCLVGALLLMLLLQVRLDLARVARKKSETARSSKTRRAILAAFVAVTSLAAFVAVTSLKKKRVRKQREGNERDFFQWHVVLYSPSNNDVAKTMLSQVKTGFVWVIPMSMKQVYPVLIVWDKNHTKKVTPCTKARH